jgi:hypothetical protein
MRIDELSTEQHRSEPVRVSLDGYKLRIGKNTVDLSGQWVDVLPTDSDEFQAVKLEQYRRAAKGEKIDANELVACLIFAWSFDDECSKDNKLKAVRIWPRVLVDHIDQVASAQVNFIKAS